jgi:hypothetical protein
LITLGLTVILLKVPLFRERLAGPTVPGPSYSAGEQIDLGSDIYGSAPQTLIFFSTATCGVCEKSKPVMTDIAADLSRSDLVRVVMVSSTRFPEEERQFAQEVGIDEQRLFRMDTAKLRVRHVPAFALVNREGTILLAKDGLITESDRRNISEVAYGRSRSR